MKRFRPDVADLVDIAFSVVLAAIGVYGFRSSFGGSEEVIVGVPAVVAGVAIGFMLAKAKVPLLVGAAVAAVAFFALGGALALRKVALAGVIPTPEVWADLVDGTVNGWARLLTTVPPAGQAGNLLAIPYLAGFLSGLLAVAVAVAVPRWPICVLPPAIVLGVSVLFGVDDPASLLLQGSVFGALTVAWIALRVRRHSPALVAGGPRRAAGGVALLGVAALGAFLVGPNLPGAGANERFLLRDRVDPPFDPSQFPSPLARYRDFHGPTPIPPEETLFTVEGLPEGEVIRFAVLDDYDGYVWRASPPGTSIGGDYQRVGDRITGAADGDAETLTFEMGALADVDSVWIPTAGSPEAITFTGDRAEALTEEFRFNRTTETAASPGALVEGDTWEVRATFPEPLAEERLAELPAAQGAPPLNLADNDGVSAQLTEWLEAGSAIGASPYQQVEAVRAGLEADGGFSDGDDPARPVPGGHGLARLVPFLEGASQPVGNGEQFAAAVAYAARTLGIPARVVLEFDPPDGDGPVRVEAEHAQAFVEIGLADVGWVRLDDPTPTDPPDPEPLTQDAPDTAGVQPPPPTTLPPPVELPEEQQREESDSEESAADGGGRDGILGLILRIAGLVAIPLALLLIPAAVVLVLKARRRSRRRRTGPPAARIAAGWHEVLDVARDIGAPVPDRSTRREVARFLATPATADLAMIADGHVFGGDEPTDDDAERVWRAVGQARASLLAPLGRVGRTKAAVSLTSLRRRR